MIKIPIEIGDIVRVGRFKNKRVKVKSIEYDEYGLPIINGRPLLTMRIEKLMEPKTEEVIKLTDLLKEADSYKEFFDKEQELFLSKPSYEDYVTQASNILPKSDKGSIWLFNHHAAELAWEDNKSSEAKKHIKIAVDNNKFQNSITFVLDFIINTRGTKDQLIQGIEQKISDSTEKKTAMELVNDPKYGGKLK